MDCCRGWDNLCPCCVFDSDPAGMKNKLAKDVRKGANPFTKEPCVFKAEPASTMHGKVQGEAEIKLKKELAISARKGVNPFTKEPSVFKAEPASKNDHWKKASLPKRNTAKKDTRRSHLEDSQESFDVLADF